MEKLPYKKSTAVAAAALSAVAMAGCSVDSYLTNTSGVACDGRRTISNLTGDGTATFIVHGKEQNDVAAVQVRRKDNLASVAVDDNLLDAQSPTTASFSEATPVVNGPELYAVAANVGWVINVNKDSVVIQGSCDSN